MSHPAASNASASSASASSADASPNARTLSDLNASAPKHVLFANLESLADLVHTWEANHRLLLKRVTHAQRLCNLRAAYLNWALDELRAVYDQLPDEAPIEKSRMFRTAQHVADLEALGSMHESVQWDVPSRRSA